MYCLVQLGVIGNDNDGMAASATGSVWLTPGYLWQVFILEISSELGWDPADINQEFS